MSTLYLKGLEQAWIGNIDLENDTIKGALMPSSYTPNAGTHQFYSDISASVADGWTDVTLAGCDIRIDTGNSRIEFDFTDISEDSLTTAGSQLAIYKDTGVAATSPLIACIDISEGTLTAVSGNISITVNAEGAFAITAT